MLVNQFVAQGVKLSVGKAFDIPDKKLMAFAFLPFLL